MAGKDDVFQDASHIFVVLGASVSPYHTLMCLVVQSAARSIFVRAACQLKVSASTDGMQSLFTL